MSDALRRRVLAAVRRAERCFNGLLAFAVVSGGCNAWIDASRHTADGGAGEAGLDDAGPALGDCTRSEDCAAGRDCVFTSPGLSPTPGTCLAPCGEGDTCEQGQCFLGAPASSLQGYCPSDCDVLLPEQSCRPGLTCGYTPVGPFCTAVPVRPEGTDNVSCEDLRTCALSHTCVSRPPAGFLCQPICHGDTDCPSGESCTNIRFGYGICG